MTIQYQIDGKIAKITLDDGKVNAFDIPLFQDLSAKLDQAKADKAGAIVIAGREGFYSGGLNTKLLPTLNPQQMAELITEFAQCMLKVWESPIPTVAAITGHAVAGGMILASACDVRVGTAGDWKYQMNEVLIGMQVPTWITSIVKSALHPMLHTRVLLHAMPFNPEYAKQYDFLHEVETTPAAVVDKALAIAKPLLAITPRGYQITKRIERKAAAEHALAVLQAELIG